MKTHLFSISYSDRFKLSQKHALSNLGNMCMHAHVCVCVCKQVHVCMCLRACEHVHMCMYLCVPACVCVCVWRWREGDVSETFVCAACEFWVSGTLRLFVWLFVVHTLGSI